MKAFRWAILIAVFSIVSPAFAVDATGITVSHFERLQNFQVEKSAASGAQKMLSGLATGMRFDAMGRTFDLQLESNDRLLSVESKLALPSSIQMLRGSIRGNSASWVRIVLADNVPRGLIWDGTDLYAIEAPGDSAVVSTQPVIYRLADSYAMPGTMSCGVTLASGSVGSAFNKLVGELNVAIAQAPGASTQLNLGAIGDSLFQADFGVDSDTAILTRLSNVDGIFSEQLGVQLQVQVLELFDNASDPFTATTDSAALLDELDVYRQGSAEQSAQGLTHLYTGRNLDGSTVGVAYNPGICRTFGAGLTQATFGAATDSLITAHELGHNFGAPHDGVPGPCESETGNFLMAVSINSSDQFSACSIAEMQQVMATANCFVPLPGTDISVTSATPPQVVLLGSSATTNFSVRNNGTADAENVSVDITIPAISDIVSVGASVGNCTAGAGTANCQLGIVTGGGTETVVISTLTSAVGVDSFSASVSATVDDNGGNNQAAVQLTVDPAVDLTLTIPPLIQLTLNQSTNVTVDVANNSILDATNIALGVIVDAGVTVDSATWTGGSCVVNGQQVDCQANTLASQASMPLVFGVTGVSAGRQNFNVTVSADEQDRNVSNNSITGSVMVNAPQEAAEDSGGGAAGFVTLLLLMVATVTRRTRKSHWKPLLRIVLSICRCTALPIG